MRNAIDSNRNSLSDYTVRKRDLVKEIDGSNCLEKILKTNGFAFLKTTEVSNLRALRDVKHDRES